MLRSTSPSCVAFNSILGDDPYDKINSFIIKIGDILEDISNEGFIKILRISRHVYNFGDMQPEPSLADCMTMMIRDEAKATEGTKLYYYLKAMVMCMLKDSLEKINADQESITNVETKIYDIITSFKAVSFNSNDIFIHPYNSLV